LASLSILGGGSFLGSGLAPANALNTPQCRRLLSSQAQSSDVLLLEKTENWNLHSNLARPAPWGWKESVVGSSRKLEVDIVLGIGARFHIRGVILL